MKIIQLKAENVKNLKALEVKADGKSVILSGKNEVGKSSVIDSIIMVLTGKQVEKPIRQGEDRAEAIIELDDYNVKRIWTEAGNRLEITNKDGMKYPSPQTFLNNIIGKLSFDPLEFKSKAPKEQKEILSKALNLNFDETDAKYKDLYATRTLINREFNSIKGAIEDLPDILEETPEEEISLSKIMSDMQELIQRRKHHDEWVLERESLEKERHSKDEQIATLEENIKILVGECVKISERRNNLPEPVSVDQKQIDELQHKADNAETSNIQVRANMKRLDLVAKRQEKHDEWNAANKKLEDLIAFKDKTLAETAFPVKGLSIKEDEVIFNDLPFSQLSESVKIKISTSIAMKLNPKLRVILIKEGSLLDSDALQEIFALCKENDYQIWIEKVSDDKELKIKIEG